MRDLSAAPKVNLMFEEIADIRSNYQSLRHLFSGRTTHYWRNSPAGPQEPCQLSQPFQGVHVCQSLASLLTVKSVSSSGDKSIKVHDIKTGNLLAVYQDPSQGFGSIDFDPSPLSLGYKPSSPDHLFKGTIVGGKSDGTIKSFHLIEVPFRKGQGDVVERISDLTIQDMLALDDETDYDDVEMETVDRPVVDCSDTSLERRTLVLQDGPVYWAECVCRPRKANASLCYECHTRPHKELVRSLKLGERYTISGSYDTHVKVSLEWSFLADDRYGIDEVAVSWRIYLGFTQVGFSPW